MTDEEVQEVLGPPWTLHHGWWRRDMIHATVEVYLGASPSVRLIRDPEGPYTAWPVMKPEDAIRLALALVEIEEIASGAPATGVEMFAAERRRQVEAKGHTPEYDDEHDAAEMVLAAHAYSYSAIGQINGICWPDVEENVPNSWPWDDASYRPSPDPIRNLVKAGAMLAAEVERLGRLAQTGRG